MRTLWRQRRGSGLLLAALIAAYCAGACGEVLSDRSDHVQVRTGDCYSCHQTDYQTAANPVHLDVMPTVCGACHSRDAWAPAGFEHSWPILGAHSKLACESCHTGSPPKYTGTPRACVGCHQKDYDSSPYPGHDAFPTSCDDCHSQVAWKPASTVAHPFPLDGAHATAPCEGCHVGTPPVYKGTPTDCYSCHNDDFNASSYPGHSGFSHTCSDCHTTTAWLPATGGGHPDNKFPLSGPHSKPKCADCHDAALSSNAKDNINCVGCHTGEHSRAKMDGKGDHQDDPKYPKGSAPVDFCLDCHADGRK